MTNEPFVTVAICTWNRSRQLAAALSSLAASQPAPHGGWEVLVVNNASTDDTSQVVASFTDRLPLRETLEPEQGIAHARNRALSETSGTHIVFIDDDVRVDPGWLATCQRLAAENPECAVLAGPVRAVFEVQPDEDLLVAFPYLRKGFCALDLGKPEGVLRNGQLPVGANMGFRQEAIRGMTFATNLGTVGGLDYGHEDVEFVRRVYDRGGAVVWSPRMSVQHDVTRSRMDIEYLLQVEERRARSRIRSIAAPTGPSWKGVPAATLLGTGIARAAFWASRLIGTRRQQLIWKVRARRFAAKVSEYRAIRRQAESSRPRRTPARHRGR